MSDLFSWDTLTSAPAAADTLNAAAILCGIIFAVGFLVAAIVSNRPRISFIATYFRRRPVARVAGLAMWIFGLGFFFFLIRMFEINPLTLGNRFWMALTAVLALLLGIWVLIATVRAVRRGPLPKARPTHSTKGITRLRYGARSSAATFEDRCHPGY